MTPTHFTDPEPLPERGEPVLNKRLKDHNVSTMEHGPLHFTISRPSQILLRYQEIARCLSQIRELAEVGNSSKVIERIGKKLKLSLMYTTVRI